MVVRLDGASGLDDGAGGPATLVAQSAAKSWLTLDFSVGSTIGSLNISSITDNATGDFSGNLTTSHDAVTGAIAGSVVQTIDTATAGMRVDGCSWAGVGEVNVTGTYVNGGMSDDIDFASFVAHGDLA